MIKPETQFSDESKLLLSGRFGVTLLQESCGKTIDVIAKGTPT
jgi:hypothetical protein